MASSSPSKQESINCPIAEIVQYSCSLTKTRRAKDGQAILHCLPISRLFQICEGRPAVEITRVVDVNVKGEIEIPRNTANALPKGKLWIDVVRFNDEDHTD